MRSLALAPLVALAACNAPADSRNKFRAVFLADTHVPGPEYACCTESNANDNDSIQKSTERLHAVVQTIEAMSPKPDLVFILGDALHNPYHSTDRAHYDTARTAFQDLRDALAGLDMPVHLAWGNHDYGIDCGAAYVSREFSHGLFRDFFATEPYHAVDFNGWRFVLGNSELGPTWDASSPSCDTELASYGREQLAWIDGQLGEGLPSTFMAHYSFFVTQRDEDPGAANPDLETVLARHADNLVFSLAGHTHVWLDFPTQYASPHHILGSSRYDDDNFWTIEFDPDHRTYEILDQPKGRHASTCADTWRYDGTPRPVAPQPTEDGSCS